MRLGRLAPLAALFVALPGCLGPTWYAGGLAAVASMEGAWDASRARNVLAQEGFTLAGDRATGQRGNEWARVEQRTDGTIELWLELRLGEKVRSEAAAEERVRGLQGDLEPRVLALVGTLENDTGWRRTGRIVWHENVLHGD